MPALADDGPSTCPELLLLVGADDPTAWERFVARYAPLIDDWCRQTGLQPADADDLRAAVLAGLVTALRGFRYDPARRFRGYLRAAVANAARRAFRDRGRKPWNSAAGRHARVDELPAPDPDALAESLDGSVSADLRTLQRAVERVRAAVAPDTWQAYVLTAVEGRTAAEAAAALGKSVAAVYMAKSRVGRLLRDARPDPA